MPLAGRRRGAAALVLSPLTRQIAALGLALCAVALSLAYPLRNYLEQQAAEQAAVAEQHQLEDQIADLKAQQAALKDPAYIKAEAKRRLQYVTPGDTVYVVKLPAAPTTSLAPPDPDTMPGSLATDGTGGIGNTVTDGTAGGSKPAGSAAGSTGSAAGSTGSAAGDAVAGDGASGASGDGSAGRQPWYASIWDTLDGAAGSVTPAR